MSQKTQCFFLATSLIGLTILGFLSGKKDWQFGCDDFGAFYSGKTAQPKDFINYFGYKTNDLTIMPTNMQDRPMSFFSVTYRPLTLAFYAFECWLLDAKKSFDAWPYFVVSIILHSLCVALFFWLLSFFVQQFLAFTAAALLAFYPFMGRCLGPFTFQPFSISLIFASIALALFLYFLKRKSQYLLWLSAFCFAIPLLMHELVITLPAWFFFIACFKNYENKSNFLSAVGNAFLQILPFVFILCVYFGARLVLFPPSIGHTQIFNPWTVLFNLKIRFYDFVTLFIELFGLSFIKAGNCMLKLFALIVVVVWCSLLWIFSSNKKHAAIAAVGAGWFCWVSLLVMHQSRYLYLSLPLLLSFIAMSAEGIIANNLFKRLLKNSVPSFFLLLTVVGLFENRQLMAAFLVRQRLIAKELQALAINPHVQNKALFFVGVPCELFPGSGIAQAIWMYSAAKEDGKKVFHDEQLNTRSLFVNEPCYDIVAQNLLSITIKNNQINLTSLGPKQVWMFAANPFGRKAACTVGKVLLQQTDKSGQKAYKVIVEIDSNINLNETKIVSWDYAKKNFIILN